MSIRSRLKALENPAIGQVFGIYQHGNYIMSPQEIKYGDLDMGFCDWHDFSKIEDNVDGFLKIKGSWFYNSDVIFYNDISKEKKKVEQKYKGKKDG